MNIYIEVLGAIVATCLTIGVVAATVMAVFYFIRELDK